MTKKNKWKSKTFKRALSDKQQLLAKLHSLMRLTNMDAKDRATARSLISWHLKRGGLSPRQWDFAANIIKRTETINNPKKVEKKQYLYGISDGDSIKLGMSHNIKSRLEALQTSNPKTLRIIWEYYSGRCPTKARMQERKLHRRCKEFKLRGEWFSLECFHLVKTFRGQD